MKQLAKDMRRSAAAAEGQLAATQRESRERAEQRRRDEQEQRAREQALAEGVKVRCFTSVRHPSKMTG